MKKELKATQIRHKRCSCDWFYNARTEKRTRIWNETCPIHKPMEREKPSALDILLLIVLIIASISITTAVIVFLAKLLLT